MARRGFGIRTHFHSISKVESRSANDPSDALLFSAPRKQMNQMKLQSCATCFREVIVIDRPRVRAGLYEVMFSIISGSYLRRAMAPGESN